MHVICELVITRAFPDGRSTVDSAVRATTMLMRFTMCKMLPGSHAFNHLPFYCFNKIFKLGNA